MRRMVRLLCLTLFFMSGAILSAQQGRQITTFTSVTTSPAVHTAGSGIVYHQLSWTKSGTVTTCTVRADSSTDGISWNTGDVVAAQDCTGAGPSSVANTAAFNYIRVNMTVLTGAGATVRAIWSGWVTNPAGGSGVSITGTSPIVMTPSPTTSTGVASCPTCAVGPGTSVANHAAKFSNTDGLTLADGGAIPTALPPNGAAGGDLTGSTYPNPVLQAVASAGACGDTTHTCTTTIDAKGRVITQTPNTIAAAGALTLVEAHTASSSASLPFTTCISATYDSYLFQMIDVIPATDANILFFTVSTDNGSTYAATNYKWADFRFVFNGSATGGTAAASTDTHILLNSATDTLSNNTSWGLNGNLYLYNPAGATFKRTLSDVSYYNGTNIEKQTATGSWDDATAVNAVKFAMNTGNIASGTIRCYGIAH